MSVSLRGDQIPQCGVLHTDDGHTVVDSIGGERWREVNIIFLLLEIVTVKLAFKENVNWLFLLFLQIYSYMHILMKSYPVYVHC